MPDPFEAARAKNRILVSIVVLVLVWALPYVIDKLMNTLTGHGILTNPRRREGKPR